MIAGGTEILNSFKAVVNNTPNFSWIERFIIVLKSWLNEVTIIVTKKIKQKLSTPYLILTFKSSLSFLVSSKSNVSNEISNSSAILIIFFLLGYVAPNSHLEIDLSLTSNNSASILCVSLFFLYILSASLLILFPSFQPLLIDFYFSFWHKTYNLTGILEKENKIEFFLAT